MEDMRNTILIVDDEPAGRETLESILEPEGYYLVPVSYTHLTLPTIYSV